MAPTRGGGILLLRFCLVLVGAGVGGPSKRTHQPWTGTEGPTALAAIEQRDFLATKNVPFLLESLIEERARRSPLVKAVTCPVTLSMHILLVRHAAPPRRGWRSQARREEPHRRLPSQAHRTPVPHHTSPLAVQPGVGGTHPVP